MELVKDPLVFKCYDREVVIGPRELQGVCDAGKVIEGLIFGQQGGIGTAHPPTLDIFSQWHSGVLNLLRACIRDQCIPDDNAAQNFVDSGELREFAESFGGFPIVDQCLAKEGVKRRRLKRRR